MHDSRWTPERDVSGNWLAVRYVPSRIPGRGLTRERDGRWWKGELLPNYHSTLEKAQARADELND